MFKIFNKGWIDIESIYKIKGIYGIKNKINSKVYVGKTQVSFGDRWDNHKAKLRNNKHDNSHLQHSWNKYGEDNFEFYIIEIINEEDNEIYNIKEKYWIKYFKDLNLSYNMSEGGDGAPGCRVSEHARKIIGEKNRKNMMGRKASLETRTKMSNAHKRQWEEKTEEEKQAFRKKCKGNNAGSIRDENLRKRISETLKKNPTCRKYTDEQIIEVRILNEVLNIRPIDISNKMNVPSNYVSAILKYKRWPDLKPTQEQINDYIKHTHDNPLPNSSNDEKV